MPDEKSSIDCFISYASPDLALARRLHDRLSQQGLRVWFDRARLDPGCDWHRDIEAACENSRIVLPVLTPNWKNSEWTRYETYGAETIIPVLLKGTWDQTSTPPLTGLFYADLTDGAESEWGRLFASIRSKLEGTAPVQKSRLSLVRYQPNPYFVGREDELNAIHEALHQGPTAELTQGRVFAIVAMGGIGKTTLARQYVEKFWRCYRQIFWVDVRLGIEGELARIFDAIFPDRATLGLTDSEKAQRALGEFSQPETRLLVVDNAEDEESVKPWLPRGGGCRVLITSRYRAWSAGVSTLPVGTLKPAAARQFLLSRSDREDSGEMEVAACDQLSKLLDYLPLALEQAAAFIRQQGSGFGFADYLELYKTAAKELLAESFACTTESAPVLTIWKATVEKLSPQARAMLLLASFLATTPFPLKMFIDGAALVEEVAQQLGGKTSPVIARPKIAGAKQAGSPRNPHARPVGEMAIRKAAAELVRYSMMNNLDHQQYSVHSLVQTVQRMQLGEDAGKRVVEQAVAIFTLHSPARSWQFENWPVWQALLPHAEALYGHLRQTDGAATDVKLLDGLAGCYQIMGRYAQAAEIAREAVEIRSRDCREDEPNARAGVYFLGMLLYKSGNYPEAERYLRHGLKICKRHLGSAHLETLTCVNHLALVLHARGDHSMAEPLFRLAIRGRERHLPANHPEVLASVHNLAMLLHGRGNHDAAEPLYRRACDSLNQVLGPDHPDTLTAENSLALLLQDRGNYDEAVAIFERVKEKRVRVLGLEHPDSIAAINNLAMCLCRRGNSAAAERLFRDALEAAMDALGPDHPQTLATMSNFAQMLESQGDYASAEKLYRESYESLAQTLGPENPETLISLNELGAIIGREGGRSEEAETILRAAKETLTRVQGEDHPHTITCTSDLALELLRRGDIDQAEPILRRALETSRKVLKAENPSTLTISANLATLLSKKGEYAEAQELYEHVFEVRTRTLGPENPDALMAANDLAEVLRLQGDFESAEPLSRHVLAGFANLTRMNSRPHRMLGEARRKYSELLAALGAGDEEIRQRIEKICGEDL